MPGQRCRAGEAPRSTNCAVGRGVIVVDCWLCCAIGHTRRWRGGEIKNGRVQTFGKVSCWWSFVGLPIRLGIRRSQRRVWKRCRRAADVVAFLRPRLHHHHVFPKAVSVGFALHHTRRHIRKGTPRARLAPHVFCLGSFLADAPADRAHRVRDAGIVNLKRTRQASALTVGQGSAMSFLNHWQFTGFSAWVASLYAVLVLSKGPIRTRAALS